MYLEARSRLFRIEAGEAGQHVTRLAVLALIAVGLVGTAWLLLLPVVVWAIAKLAGCSWQPVAGVLGIAHLLAAFGLALHLKAITVRLSLFGETINQCRRDAECLRGKSHGTN